MAPLLLFGDTERSAALRHEIPLNIIDPLLFAESAGGQRFVLTSSLERDRIQAALPDVEIHEFYDLGLKELIEQGMSRERATDEVVVRALERIGINEAVVPGDFPLALGDRVRAAGLRLRIDDEAVQARRRVKLAHEIEGIRAAQRAGEAAMAAAEVLLSAAVPGDHDRLYVDGSELTAEQVRAAARGACAELGAPAHPDIIVASVWNGFGHEPGHGPLPSGLPIQIDIWNRDEASACWSDMTRTFLIGEPASEAAELIAAQEQLVRAALEAARGAARPGVSGRELYEMTCERFEAAGHRTQRTGGGEHPNDGFQFSLGHGVGLEVHEPPSLGLSGRETLLAGDVIAIEPGLWDHRVGGVRFEDMLLITDEGCETLTSYGYSLTAQPTWT